MPAKKSPGPSVKDKKLYEKLRGEGNSKEKSARIANSAAGTSRRKVSKKGGKAPCYDDWSASISGTRPKGWASRAGRR